VCLDGCCTKLTPVLGKIQLSSIRCLNMLPALTALPIGARPSDPDDVLAVVLMQLALQFDISSVRYWVSTNREFARVARDSSIWREVLKQQTLLLGVTVRCHRCHRTVSPLSPEV